MVRLTFPILAKDASHLYLSAILLVISSLPYSQYKEMPTESPTVSHFGCPDECS